VVLCLLVSLGTAGVPGTAIITATAVLTAVGLPVEILVVLVPISAVAGTASTMANVSAAATAATVVARRQGHLDDDVFAGRKDPADDASSSRPAAPRRRRVAETRELAPLVGQQTAVLPRTDALPIDRLPTPVPLGQCSVD